MPLDKNGIPVRDLIKILDAFRTIVPSATVDTDDSQLGILRVNYNGPQILDMGPRAAELFNDAKVQLCDGYAEIPLP